MSLIDRYILKEWCQGFALTLAVIVGILILHNMYDTLSDLLEIGASLGEVVFYYTLALPAYLPAILPIALLVSLLFSLGTLHRNNEIIALRAAGIGLFQISRSLWVAGLLLSGLLFYLTAALVPVSVEYARTFLDNLEYAAMEARPEMDTRQRQGLVYNLGFDNQQDGRLWLMNRFSERAWLALGVNVHTRSETGQELNRISAREAYFDDTQGHWVFVDGRELLLDPKTGDPLRTIAFEQKTFETFDEDPGLMLALHKDPEALSLFELRRVVEALPPQQNPVVHAYLVRYLSLLAAPFSCLVVVGLAVPFAVSGVRTNPIIGISKCMGYFLVFYLLVSTATILGERHIISAALAAWLPNLVMFALAGRLFRQAR